MPVTQTPLHGADKWTMPHQPMDPSERMMRHGKVQPMREPNYRRIGALLCLLSVLVSLGTIYLIITAVF